MFVFEIVEYIYIYIYISGPRDPKLIAMFTWEQNVLMVPATDSALHCSFSPSLYLFSFHFDVPEKGKVHGVAG
jgi:hypothetical protein